MAVLLGRLKLLAVWAAVPIMVAAWLLFGSQRLGPADLRPADRSTEPRYRLKGIEWTRLDEQGRPTFVAQAEAADYFDDESARYEDLRVSVLGTAGQPWLLTSPLGSAPPGERRLSLDGPVTISGYWPDGGAVKLETPQLWVEPDTHQLHTEAGVVFDGSGRAGRSKGLRADWERQTVRLTGGVRMRYVAR